VIDKPERAGIDFAFAACHQDDTTLAHSSIFNQESHP